MYIFLVVLLSSVAGLLVIKQLVGIFKPFLKLVKLQGKKSSSHLHLKQQFCVHFNGHWFMQEIKTFIKGGQRTSKNDEKQNTATHTHTHTEGNLMYKRHNV